MSKRKYQRFTLVADFGQVNEQFENYSDAFSSYQGCNSPKTLYGFDEQDNPSVVFSKG